MQKDMVGARYKYPVSDEELKRRLDSVQAAMKEEGIDCLVLQTHSFIFDSNIRYFLDAQTGTYSSALLIPAEGGMIHIAHGSDDDNAPVPKWARNTDKFIVNSYCPPFAYSDDYVGKIVEKEIRSRGFKKVAFAGLQLIGYALGNYLTRNLPDVEFTDFSFRLNEIKAVKSAEEWELIALSIDAHARLLDCAPSLIIPGRAEYEIRADLEYRAHMTGCDTVGNIAVGSSPPGGFSMFVPHFRANRRIEEGDMVTVMIEVSGPGGMYGELARTYCLGEPTENLVSLFEIAKEAQHLVADAAKPGVTGAHLNSVFNECMSRYGLPPNKRVVGHGQGYDMMESPAICEDETMELKEDMLLAIHPELERDTEFVICCDNFRVTGSGAKILGEYPQKLFML